MAKPNKPLKIGLVLDGGGLDRPDGVQQYILALGEWFRTQDHEVHYLVGETKRTDIPGVHSLSRNFRVKANGNSTSIPLPTSRSKLRKFLDAEQFDVLHVQTPYNPFMGEQLVLLAGPKTAIIGTFHILPNSWLVGFGTRLLGLWSHRSLKRFDAMFSVSPAAAEFAKATFGVESRVLPNVIDYERFHTAEPFSRYQDKTLTILFFGRLVPRKGCLLLLKAIYQLKQLSDLPKFRVLICGKGPMESQLKQFIDKKGLQDLVTLTGFINEADKPKYYASADISVFPSNGGESFGIVLLEAMGSGRAVVLAGNNPGYASVMSPRPDLLFDPNNSKALAEKLSHYLQSSQERRNAQLWGADYVKQFDVNVVGAKLLNTYYEVLLKKRGA